MKNVVVLSGFKDLQESFKLLKSNEAFYNNNNGAIKKIGTYLN